MNKITLDENQLLQLKRFILTKGIKEEDVINEILDHFACKVEELMNENVYLSFKKAIEQAYYSFGFNGFKKMSEQYEKRIKKMVWAEFKSALPTVLQRKFVVGSILWCAILFVATYYVSETKTENWLTESHTYVCFASCMYFLGSQFYSWMIAKDGIANVAADKLANLWQKKVVHGFKIQLFNLPIIFAFPLLKFDVNYYLFILTTMALFGLIGSLTRKETMKRMRFKFNSPYTNG